MFSLLFTSHFDLKLSKVFIHYFIHLFLSLFLLGVYGIYLLPSRYKTVTVDSNLTPEKKQNIISKLLKEYKAYRNSNEHHYTSFKLRPRFWNMSYDVYLFFDEAKFAFSIQPQDYSNGGFLDFGAAERKINEIANRIMELCIEELSAANIGFVQ